jgi:methylglyoxal synthase
MQDVIRAALGLPPEQALAIERHCTLRSMREGDVIIQKESVPSFLAIVISGRVSLVSLNGSDIQLGPGELLGEVAFMSQKGRTAQVVARAAGEIMVLTYDALNEIEEADPRLALTVVKALARIATRRLVADFVAETRYLALIAQDGCKEALLGVVRQNWDVIQTWHIVSTASTGAMLERETDLQIRRKVASGPLGGDQEIGALVARGALVAVLLFKNPLTSEPHEADVHALMRLCDVHRVPLATNVASAHLLLTALAEP